MNLVVIGAARVELNRLSRLIWHFADATIKPSSQDRRWHEEDAQKEVKGQDEPRNTIRAKLILAR
jgi:hypothetical protein